MKNKVDQGEKPREEKDTEGELDLRKMEEQSNIAPIPTKLEMMEMFAKLENSIKSEITNVRMDMGHLLRIVEEAEELTGKQAQEISDLKTQMRKMQMDHRDTLYKS